MDEELKIDEHLGKLLSYNSLDTGNQFQTWRIQGHCAKRPYVARII